MAITLKHVLSGSVPLRVASEEVLALPRHERLKQAAKLKASGLSGINRPIIVHRIGDPLPDLGGIINLHLLANPGTSLSILTSSDVFAKYVHHNRGLSYDQIATLRIYDPIENPQQEIESVMADLRGKLSYQMGELYWIPGLNHVDELIVTHNPAIQ